MAFSTSTSARWTTLSSSAATPSGRCRPSALGMYALREGFARYAPRCSRPCSSRRLTSSSPRYCCQLTPSTPAAACLLSASKAARSRSTVTWCRSAVNLTFLSLRLLLVRGPAHWARLLGTASVARFAGPRFPCLGPFTPRPPQQPLPLCSAASSVLRTDRLFRACIAGSGSSPSRHAPRRHPRRTEDLPVPAHGASVHAWGLRPRRVE